MSWSSACSVRGLHPAAAEAILPWLHRCGDIGLDLLVYCVGRASAEQARLYRTNRNRGQIDAGIRELRRLGLPDMAALLASTPPQPGVSGKKKTNALPGLSFHQPHAVAGEVGAFAVDFVPMIAGKADWMNAQAYEVAGVEAESLGLVWSGRWHRMKERCHVQWDDGGKLTMPGLARGDFG